MTLKQLLLAALLNAFALPGAGQWYLQHKRRSAVFIIPSLVLVVLLMYHMLHPVFTFDRSALKSTDAALAMVQMMDTMMQAIGPDLRFLAWVSFGSLADLVFLFVRASQKSSTTPSV